MIVLFGIVSGILAVFNFSICTLPIFKYKIFTFLLAFYSAQLVSGIFEVEGGFKKRSEDFYF